MSITFHDKDPHLDIPSCYSDRLIYNPKAHTSKVDSQKLPNVSVFDKFTYFADRNKKWPFYTGSYGAKLLLHMFVQSDKAIAIAQKRIDSTPEPETTELEGENIYNIKDNIQKAGITWSQEEYRHPGFQKRYLQLKSIQRFTEMYSMLQRMYNVGFFEPYIRADLSYQLSQYVTSLTKSNKDDCDFMKGEYEVTLNYSEDFSETPDSRSLVSQLNNVISSTKDEDSSSPSTVPPPRPFVVASLGGGPGFELLAVQAFMSVICPNTPVEGVSVDCEGDWEDFVNAMNISYDTVSEFQDIQNKELDDCTKQIEKRMDNDTNSDIKKKYNSMRFVKLDLSAQKLDKEIDLEFKRKGIAQVDGQTCVDLYILSYVYQMYMSHDPERSRLFSLISPIVLSDLDDPRDRDSSFKSQDVSKSVDSVYTSIINRNWSSQLDKTHSVSNTKDDLVSIATRGICIVDRNFFIPSFNDVVQDSDKYSLFSTMRNNTISSQKGNRDDRQTLVVKKGYSMYNLMSVFNCLNNSGYTYVRENRSSIVTVESDCEPVLNRRALFTVNISFNPTTKTVIKCSIKMNPVWITFPNVPYEEKKKNKNNNYNNRLAISKNIRDDRCRDRDSRYNRNERDDRYGDNRYNRDERDERDDRYGDNRYNRDERDERDNRYGDNRYNRDERDERDNRYRDNRYNRDDRYRDERDGRDRK